MKYGDAMLEPNYMSVMVTALSTALFSPLKKAICMRACVSTPSLLSAVISNGTKKGVKCGWVWPGLNTLHCEVSVVCGNFPGSGCASGRAGLSNISGQAQIPQEGLVSNKPKKRCLNCFDYVEFRYGMSAPEV